MRVFHQIVYDGLVAGVATQAGRTGPDLHALLGSVDLLNVGGYTFNVTGGGPLLTLSVESSADLITWSTSSLFTGLTLSTTQETLFQASDLPIAGIKNRFVRLAFNFGGGGQGYLRAWVTGRDQMKAAAPPPGIGASSGMLGH